MLLRRGAVRLSGGQHYVGHNLAFGSSRSPTACGPFATTGGTARALVCVRRPCARSRMSRGAVCAALWPHANTPLALHWSGRTAFPTALTGFVASAAPMW